LSDANYPLFETMLRSKGLTLQATYTCQDIADLFGVTARTIQNKVKDGTLPSLRLIGGARFLPIDIEEYLRHAAERGPRMDSFGITVTTPNQGGEPVTNPNQSLYPLFETMLRCMGLSLQPTYTCQEVASLFGVTARTVQSKVADGTIPSRRLLGGARFLPADIEEYLRNSAETPPR
jgi:excisionase family DNA binding protein